MKPRIIELSEQQERLWDAFRGAEREYIPSGLKPLSATKEFWRLWKAGYLRLYEFYLMYWLAALVCSAMACFGGQPAFFLGFVGFLVPGVHFGRKHVEQFAFQKTEMMGLDRFGFGVAHLPLLVHGMIRLLDESKAASSADGPAVLTKNGLASIIKLVKVGHEHGEVRYGFTDLLKKVAYAIAGGAIGWAYAHRTEIDKDALAVWQALAGNWRLSAVAVVLMFGASAAIYSVFVSEINEKRRTRRYLLTLNVMHETWPGE